MTMHFVLFLFSLSMSNGCVKAQQPTLEELLNQRRDTTFLRDLVSGNPQLQKFYSDIPENDTTCFLPTDTAFWRYSNTSWGSQILRNQSFVYNSFAYPCVKGVYNTSSFTNLSSFFHSRWSNPIMETVEGGQVLEAVQESGGPTVYTGLGTSLFRFSGIPTPGNATAQIHPGAQQKAFITEPDIPFQGGLVHLLDDWTTIPSDSIATAQALDLTASGSAAGYDTLYRGNLSAMFTIMLNNNISWPGYYNAIRNLTFHQQVQAMAYGAFDEVFYTDAFTSNGTQVMNQAGGNVTLKRIDDNLFVDTVGVQAMYPTANGALYVLQGVLLPPDL